MKRKTENIKFDCHGLNYSEVEDKLPNWILMNQNSCSELQTEQVKKFLRLNPQKWFAPEWRKLSPH